MVVGTTSTKGRMVKVTDVEFTENGTYIPSENTTAFGKVTVNVSSSTGTIIPVINNSSVDRFVDEKVWIRQITGGWEIVDWGSVDITCLSGKCETNIDMGQTGNVLLVDDGIIMNHSIRDFELSSGLTEANIDDNLQLLTINSTVENSFIYKQMLLPTSLGEHFRLKIKYKIVNISGLEDISGIRTSLACCGRQGTTNWEGYAPGLSLGRKNNDTTDYFIGNFAYYEGGIDASYRLYKAYSGILNFDTWITMYLDELNNRIGEQIGGKLTIVDAQGNESIITSRTNGIFVYDRKGIRIGNNAIRDKNFNIVYDLSQCGIFDTNDNSTIWTPYIQQIV